MSHARDVLYLGRGTSYPLALEGALKLKEISYIHAEGYAAGELKHGPIALVDTRSAGHRPGAARHCLRQDALEHAGSRGARRPVDPHYRAQAPHDFGGEVEAIVMPEMAPDFSAIVYAVPVQMIAYHTAVFMGKDADQPRNLAKSVTVE